MSYKQQITPWSIYDNFKPNSDPPSNSQTQKIDRQDKKSEIEKINGCCNERINCKLEQIVKHKTSEKSRGVRKQNQNQHKSQLISQRKIKNIISGKSIKYQTFEGKQKKSSSKFSQKNKALQVQTNLYQSLQFINMWTIVNLVKQSLMTQPNSKKDLMLPKISSIEKSDTLRYQSNRQYTKIKKQRMQLSERSHRKQKQGDYQTIHIGRVLSSISKEKILKQFGKRKGLEIIDEHQKYEFPKNLSKHIKYRDMCKSSQKNLLSNLYQKPEEFSDKIIHQKMQVARRNVKKSRIKPIIIKHSNFQDFKNNPIDQNHQYDYKQ